MVEWQNCGMNGRIPSGDDISSSADNCETELCQGRHLEEQVCNHHKGGSPRT